MPGYRRPLFLTPQNLAGLYPLSGSVTYQLLQLVGIGEPCCEFRIYPKPTRLLRLGLSIASSAMLLQTALDNRQQRDQQALWLRVLNAKITRGGPDAAFRTATMWFCLNLSQNPLITQFNPPCDLLIALKRSKLRRVG